jgi:L,D-transpeptidase YbiS
MKITLNSFFESIRKLMATWVEKDSRIISALSTYWNIWTQNNALRAKAVVSFIAVVFLVFILIYIQFLAPAIWENSTFFIPRAKTSIAILDTIQLNTLKKEYLKKTLLLESKMKQNSKSPYIVINSTQNEFKLYSGGNLIREGICSTGSYVKLEYNDKQKWVFRTPKGMLKIKNKTKFPVWKKPDWAFIEEGKPVPSPNSPLRFEYGVLGDYSLALGDGYLIHGTLYQRLLGMPVTHGCVRLGDDDLEAVYRSLRIGDRVFIY